MESLRDNKLIFIGIALAILIVANSNIQNRFLSITEPQTITILNGGPIEFGGVSSVVIRAEYNAYYSTSTGVAATVSASDSTGTLFSHSCGRTYTLIPAELDLIQGKVVTFHIGSGGSQYWGQRLVSVTYTESVGFIAKIKPFYRQGAEETISVKTIHLEGLRGVLIFNGKQYTAFTDADGMLNFDVTIPNTIGKYPATVSANDPWSGTVVKKDFNIEVRAVTIITWEAERVAYTNEEYKIRFNVKDAQGNVVEPSFLPTVTGELGGYSVTTKVKYVSSGTYEVTATPAFSGKLILEATTEAYGLEPSTQPVSIDVIKATAKVTHNINTEETIGAKTYTINVLNPRNDPIDATVTVTVDEPLGARKTLEVSRISQGKYALVFRPEQVGVYYWNIDVSPTSGIDPVSVKITMNVAENKTPVSEIGSGILTSPIFSVGIIGVAVVAFIIIWRMRKQQQV